MHRAFGIAHLLRLLSSGGKSLTKRRAFILGSVGIAGLAAWRYRLLQVAGYTLAAGLRRELRSDPAPDFQTLAPQWSTLKPTRTYLHVRSRGMITYHPW